MRIDGVSALVTGAASGLGAATARLLAERGATVVGIDLRTDGVDAPPGVRLVPGDVTNEPDVVAAIEQTGPAPLRIVVNCAGVAPARRLLSGNGPHDVALFRRTLEVNLVGTFVVMAQAAAAIARQQPDEQGQRGVIVNTASIAAFEGQVGQTAYAASKGGVVGLTVPAARDLARHGIRVNTIAPGIVDTPLLAALGPAVNASLAASVPFPPRLGRPDEFAQLVASIVENDYLNAATIRLDGALRMGAS